MLTTVEFVMGVGNNGIVHIVFHSFVLNLYQKREDDVLIVIKGGSRTLEENRMLCTSYTNNYTQYNSIQLQQGYQMFSIKGQIANILAFVDRRTLTISRAQ